MPKKLTNIEFIAKSEVVHGGRYEYVNTQYSGSAKKVGITCRIHGEFFTRAGEHLKGRNCQRCVNLHLSVKNRRGGADILQQLLSCSPGDIYTYPDLGEFSKTADRMSVLCPIHGSFLTRPTDIFNGSGCPNCWKKRRKVSHV